jgi:hypothetical protein
VAGVMRIALCGLGADIVLTGVVAEALALIHRHDQRGRVDIRTFIEMNRSSFLLSGPGRLAGSHAGSRRPFPRSAAPAACAL